MQPLFKHHFNECGVCCLHMKKKLVLGLKFLIFSVNTIYIISDCDSNWYM